MIDIDIEDSALGCILLCGIILGITLGIFGYIRNIVKLTKLDFKEPYKAEIIRTIGLIPPVGAITGWINIEDK